MKKTKLILLMLACLSIGYLLGFFSQSNDEKKLQELTAHNNALKKQQKQLGAILVEKDAKYKSLIEQVSELDKLLVAQEQNEKDILEDLTVLANSQYASPTENAIKSYALSQQSGSIEGIDDSEVSTNAEVVNSTLMQSNQDSQKQLSNNSQDKSQDKSPNKSQEISETIHLALSPRKKFPPSAFRTIEGVNVIDENNRVQEFWEQGTSFAAREQYGSYYKVSGYFIDKKWTRAENMLLISKLKAVKR